MADLTDLSRLDGEIAELRARLDDLIGQYNDLAEAVNRQTLDAMDLSDIQVRTGEALRKLPAAHAALEEILAVHDEVCNWASDAFPDSDEPWRELRTRSGVETLDDALGVVADRINAVIARGSKEGDGERARGELDAIVGGIR